MERVYYSYEEFLEDSKTLLVEIEKYKPDAIVAIARGGMCLSHLLSQALDLRDVFSINSILYDDTNKQKEQKIFNIPDLKNYKKILIVDDIIDSGETAQNVTKLLKDKFSKSDIKLASIFYKKSAIIEPDFKVKIANDWIDFFWEVDLKK